MVTRTIHLSDDVNALLEAQAKATGTSVDDALNALLRMYSDRRQMVEEGLADAAAGRTVDNASMKAWLETWGADDEKDAPACPE